MKNSLWFEDVLPVSDAEVELKMVELTPLKIMVSVRLMSFSTMQVLPSVVAQLERAEKSETETVLLLRRRFKLRTS